MAGEAFLAASGLSFGGVRRADVAPEHPAIASLVAAISALKSNHPRKAVELMELAMDAISELDELYCEF